MFTRAVLLAALLGSHVFALRKQNNARNLIIGGGGLHEEYYRFFTSLESTSGVCGASLIAPELLLTAAHCSLAQAAQVGYFTASDVRQTINIDTSFDHPAFNPVSLFYDFKIVKLASPAGPNATLVPLNSNSSFPTDRETLLVMGVGDSDPTSSVGMSQNSAIQGAIVRIEDNEECENTRGLSASYADSIFESMFCTFRTRSTAPSNGASNACNGDNGGPLLAADYEGERPDPSDVGVQVGVVSWGYDSCHNGNRFPRVYARVSDAYDWIRFIVCRESTNPPASFNCDGNVAEPPLPSPPSSPVATNPIKFRYVISTDGFPYENGVRIEEVSDTFPRTFQHVVPAALPASSTFTQTLDVSRDDLYAFSIVDTSGNGLQGDSRSIELQMEQPDGNFATFRTIRPDFGSAEVVFFYGTADGTVADPFDKPKSFPGDKFLTLTVGLDDYPEEVSITLFTGTQKVWTRPYRYYTKRPRETITENIPIPNDRREYTLTIFDSEYDGIVSGIEIPTNYTLSYYDTVLVDDSFDSLGVSANTFTFDPSVYDTESPTASPTAPSTSTIGSTPSPTLSPTKENIGREIPSSSLGAHPVGYFATFCAFVSGVVAFMS